jgi:hypothetical protein
VAFDPDRGSFRTFANPSEASYEDDEPASQLELPELWTYNAAMNVVPNSKTAICLTLYECTPKDKYGSAAEGSYL